MSEQREIAVDGIRRVIAGGTRGLWEWARATRIDTPTLVAMAVREFERRDPVLYVSIVHDSAQDSTRTLFVLVANAARFGFAG